jgi:hypothetical protein
MTFCHDSWTGPSMTAISPFWSAVSQPAPCRSVPRGQRRRCRRTRAGALRPSARCLLARRWRGGLYRHCTRSHTGFPIAFYVLFTITASLPRVFPHSATCRVLHGVSSAGSDSMQRVLILPLVASLAFFVALPLVRGGRGSEPPIDVRAELRGSISPDSVECHGSGLARAR